MAWLRPVIDRILSKLSANEDKKQDKKKEEVSQKLKSREKDVQKAKSVDNARKSKGKPKGGKV